jgi:hypothetical protein
VLISLQSQGGSVHLQSAKGVFIEIKIKKHAEFILSNTSRVSKPGKRHVCVETHTRHKTTMVQLVEVESCSYERQIGATLLYVVVL